MEALLARTPYGVTTEGIDVVMTVGTAQCRMDYATALKLATFLYHSGSQAKRNAGDFAVNMIGLATLTDGNAEELKADLSRDRTAVFSRV